MEEILKQSFKFADILLYKNYSTLEESGYMESNSESRRTCVLSLYPKDKCFFFYDTDNNGNWVTLKQIKNFTTTNNKHIKKYYGNPFASISVTILERQIKRDGNKIILKYYASSRTRGLNYRYFHKHTESRTVTFDMETGNFKTILFSKTGKENRKRFYCNSFTSLTNLLSQIIVGYNSKKMTDIQNKYRMEFLNELQRLFNFNFNLHETSINADKITSYFVRNWVRKFVEIKKIKVPNNYYVHLTSFYPTERYLKKNDRKLIASILDRYGIKSNATIKILHKNPNINVAYLICICKIFGNNYTKYIGNISPCFFENKEINQIDVSLNYDEEALNIVLEENEKSCLISVINNYYSLNYIDSNQIRIIHYIFDHIKMLNKIKEYYPDFKLTARTFNSFSEEHLRLSNLERLINKGFIKKRIFDQEIINEIEKPIEINGFEKTYSLDEEFGDFENISHNVFTLKILKTSEDYFEEGSYMHHCVNSYIDTDSSIIVSLRKGNERVTCEFEIKSGNLLQDRYFTNQKPPSHFISPLEELCTRMKKYAGKLKPIEIKKIYIDELKTEINHHEDLIF